MSEPKQIDAKAVAERVSIRFCTGPYNVPLTNIVEEEILAAQQPAKEETRGELCVPLLQPASEENIQTHASRIVAALIDSERADAAKCERERCKKILGRNWTTLVGPGILDDP